MFQGPGPVELLGLRFRKHVQMPLTADQYFGRPDKFNGRRGKRVAAFFRYADDGKPAGHACAASDDSAFTAAEAIALPPRPALQRDEGNTAGVCSQFGLAFGCAHKPDRKAENGSGFGPVLIQQFSK